MKGIRDSNIPLNYTGCPKKKVSIKSFSRSCSRLHTLEGHSDIDVKEKRTDGQENGWTRKRRRRMPWNHATVLCLCSANHIWVRVHEQYSNWLISLWYVLIQRQYTPGCPRNFQCVLWFESVWETRTKYGGDGLLIGIVVQYYVVYSRFTPASYFHQSSCCGY